MSNLINFTAALSDDTSHKIIGNVDLLRLELLWWIMGRWRRWGCGTASATVVRIRIAWDIG